MKRYLRLIRTFIALAAQNEFAYRANFAVSLLHSLLTLGTGVLGLAVVFAQVETLQGWSYAEALAVLGVYLLVGALQGLVISPGLDELAGMEGEVWRGTFDFTLLRPCDVQLLVSVRRWRLFALFDLLLGLIVLGLAVARLGQPVTLAQVAAFLLTLVVSITVLYAILLVFASLVFWSPGLLFTWVFDGLFQMARYPIGVYPGWLRPLLTWVVPIGVITTVPARALSGELSAACSPAVGRWPCCCSWRHPNSSAAGYGGMPAHRVRGTPASIPLGLCKEQLAEFLKCTRA